VEEAARKRWGAEVIGLGVKTLDAATGVRSFMVGTLYKDMKGKPSIMDELTRDVLEQPVEGQAKREGGKYCGEGDCLLLEDESGRVALDVPAELADDTALITGVVVGVVGTLSDAGELVVEGFCVPGLPPQPAAAPVGNPREERYIALVSGLRVGQDETEMLPLQLLAEHLTGQLGCDEDHRLQANIVRLVVAGNATSSPEGGYGGGVPGSAAAPDVLKKVTPQSQAALSQHVRTLDQFLTAVAAAIPVDLIPGADDPCSFLLPQQPLHACMLPQSSRLSSLNLCTNPYCADVDGVRILGTAGQPLDDMQRYLPHEDRMRTLERSLEFQHLAPTAPDTLGCYAYDDASSDPFVVRECPHIYFAGNQPRFESKLVEGPAGQRVRAIMVPDFSKDRTCVLVDLKTLECQPIVFSGLGGAEQMQTS
jgi:DNA polymerase delta subunit 2